MPSVGGKGHLVKVPIWAEVYEAAIARAQQQEKPLTVIAQTLVYLTSDCAPTPEQPVRAKASRRPPNARTQMVRLRVDRDKWNVAIQRIRIGGSSVVRVLELGLAHYARTGVVKPVTLESEE